ncbi:FkbM family methyltransferase [Oricola cellulosilytica]|uniref:FkbM family methyltransferase n=1 Tax=Oricola cellulosilytica TaxID=1429082 RepID=A0A4R0P2C7_9HYPH|nr:FkbM family methyltransferase [Oricola cellulosilytica]TCD10977.1 FkbM family methyltransferase [Oricola cellulosilytica]
MKLRDIETRFRQARKQVMKSLTSGKRGRKFLLDMMPTNVMAVTVDCGDHKMTVSPHEMIGRHVFATNAFERGQLTSLLDILNRRNLISPKGNILLEIGANIGTHTVYFGLSEQFERIISVEPDPRNLELLRRNVSDNGLSDIVKVVPCAAGTEKGVLNLNRIDGNHGNSSLLNETLADDSIAVQVEPVSGILKSAGISEADLSLVWIDAEGYEPQICRSMINLMRRQVPMMVEFSPEFYGPAGTRDFADMLGDFYETCVMFERAGQRLQTVVRTRDLATLKSQRDILFVPPDRQVGQ